MNDKLKPLIDSLIEQKKRYIAGYRLLEQEQKEFQARGTNTIAEKEYILKLTNDLGKLYRKERDILTSIDDLLESIAESEMSKTQ